MVEDRSASATTWGRVALSVAPGVWFIIRWIGGFKSPAIEVVDLVVTVVVLLAGVAASLALDRRLSAWCFPAFGALLWEMWHLSEWISYGRRLATVPSMVYRLDVLLEKVPEGVIIIVALAGSACTLWWIYQQFRGAPRRVWGLAVLMFVLVLFSDRLLYGHVFRYWYEDVFLWLPLLLAPVALGSHFTKRDGLAASLVVTSCGPFWVDYLMTPRGPVYYLLEKLYGSPAVTGLRAALLPLFYLPVIGFLFVIPLGLLRSRSTRMRIGWVLLPSLLTLSMVSVIGGLVLTGTEIERSLGQWISDGLYVLQLWLALLLATLLYSSRSQSAQPVTEPKPDLGPSP